jgi:hypothetical protein
MALSRDTANMISKHLDRMQAEQQAADEARAERRQEELQREMAAYAAIQVAVADPPVLTASDLPPLVAAQPELPPGHPPVRARPPCEDPGCPCQTHIPAPVRPRVEEHSPAPDPGYDPVFGYRTPLWHCAAMVYDEDNQAVICGCEIRWAGSGMIDTTGWPLPDGTWYHISGYRGHQHDIKLPPGAAPNVAPPRV